jgi:uncharacterized membrane protein YfcA
LTQYIQHRSKAITFTLLSISISILFIIMMVYQVPSSNRQAFFDITNLLMHYRIIILSLVSGAIVGFSLGFIGGGGSILAVPLLLYVVGIENPHLAIGTSALAVSVNAAINILHHARHKNIKFMKGLVFGIPGLLGTLLGSQLGLLTPANNLVFFFGILMLAIAANMLIRNRYRNSHARNQRIKTRFNIFYEVKLPKPLNFFGRYRLELSGLLVGLAAGYFGIGGGFLIVPSLVYSGLNIGNAIGTSLVPVSMFGAATAIRYSLENQINIFLSLLLTIGGVGGGLLGTKMLTKVSKNSVTNIFAIIIIVVGVYIIMRFLLS